MNSVEFDTGTLHLSTQFLWMCKFAMLHRKHNILTLYVHSCAVDHCHRHVPRICVQCLGKGDDSQGV
jgi:hypothetical protein